MSNPQKRKGDRAERAVVAALHEHGFVHAERSRAGWADDKGDIQGVAGVVIEVKDQKRHDLPGWLRELETEMTNAGAVTGVLVVKRAGHPDASDWYAVMRFADWCHLIEDAAVDDRHTRSGQGRNGVARSLDNGSPADAPRCE